MGVTLALMSFSIVCISLSGQCACPEIPRRSLTLPPEGKNCFNVSDRYRYTCIPGYVRKAGTSNLIKCNNHSQWTTTKFPLECIRKVLFLSLPTFNNETLSSYRHEASFRNRNSTRTRFMGWCPPIQEN